MEANKGQPMVWPLRDSQQNQDHFMDITDNS